MSHDRGKGLTFKCKNQHILPLALISFRVLIALISEDLCSHKLRGAPWQKIWTKISQNALFSEYFNRHRVKCSVRHTTFHETSSLSAFSTVRSLKLWTSTKLQFNITFKRERKFSNAMHSSKKYSQEKISWLFHFTCISFVKPHCLQGGCILWQTCR